MAAPLPDKYRLYEAAVQSASESVDCLQHFYRDEFGRAPKVLREDFCGTFAVCCEWVRRGRENRAVGLDLDPEPLRYGALNHHAKLTEDQRERVQPLEQDVLSVTKPKADVAVAGNFSFFVFKERKTLLRYFTSVHRSLGAQGLLALEVAGGPGMIAPLRETRSVHAKGLGRFKYTWHQQQFFPLTREARYAIHFQLSGGRRLKDAFTYDWRLWTPPELKDALLEAGFDATCVYWYRSRRGGSEYVRTERGENDHAWLAYVVGIKGRTRRRGGALAPPGS